MKAYFNHDDEYEDSNDLFYFYSNFGNRVYKLGLHKSKYLFIHLCTHRTHNYTGNNV